MRIVVTGGAGFIGSHFVNKFHKEHELFVIDSLTYAGNLDNIIASFPFETNFFEIDIAEKRQVDAALKTIAPDAIINFAAESHVDNSISTPLEFTRTNIVGTHNLLEFARLNGVSKFIQVSTDEVYGHLGKTDPPFTEKTPLNPRSPYSATKAASDMLVQSYVNTFGLHACITRCSNNFGENQHAEKLIPTIIRNAALNLPIPIYGNGENIRDWIYVEDHIDGIYAVFEKGKSGEVYNFGGISGVSEVTNLDLCKMVLNIMAKDHSLITYVNDRLGHDFRYAIDYTKANLELDWSPRHDLTKLETVINSYISKISG